jgi:hypothetical protein
LLPAREPGSRTAWVDAGTGAQVLSVVEQHVDQSRAHLARCPERMRVIPVVPDPPAPVDCEVDRPRTTPREALDPRSEGIVPVRLDEEMQMILLNGEVDDAKVRTVRGSQGVPQVREQAARSERWQSPPRPQRHVDRLLRPVGRPRFVSRACAGGGRPATSPLAPAPPAGRLGERQLSRPAAGLIGHCSSSARAGSCCRRQRRNLIGHCSARARTSSTGGRWSSCPSASTVSRR